MIQMFLKIYVGQCSVIGERKLSLNLLSKRISAARFLSQRLRLSSKFESSHSSIPTISFKKFNKVKLENERKQKNLPPGLHVGRLILRSIGSGAAGSPKSLCVQVDNNGLLFNCGENISRHLNEHQKLFSCISHIFLTSSSWDNVSGMACFQETFSRNWRNEKALSSRGPADLVPLMNIFGSFRSHMSNKMDKSLNFVDIRDDVFKINESFTVRAVPLNSSKREECEERETRFFKSDVQEQLKNNKYALAYICTCASNPGTVSIESLIEADIPPGPLVHELREGKSVTLDDGRVVTPEEVSKYKYPGCSFFVIEVPNENYLDSLISSSAFEPFQNGADEHPLEVIVHFTPSRIMKDPRYREWVNSFPPSVSHMVINDKSTCFGLEQSLKLQMILNSLLPSVFPMLQGPNGSTDMTSPDPDITSSDPVMTSPTPDMTSSTPDMTSPTPDMTSSTPVMTSSDPVMTSITPDMTPSYPDMTSSHAVMTAKEYQFLGPTTQAFTSLAYSLRPDLNFCSKDSPELQAEGIMMSERMEEEDVKEALVEIRKRFRKLDAIKDKSPAYPNFVFLGTGSGNASSFRNATGIIVNLSPMRCMLMDCGEGTLNQLIRFMGLERAHETLRKLDAVFCSHHHLDHYVGLPSILIQREKAFKIINKKPGPLYLLVTTVVSQYLRGVHYNFYPILKDITLVNNNNIHRDGKFYDEMLNSRICDALRLKTLTLTKVPHCTNAYGISFTNEDGIKITYSGDSMPSNNLVEIGFNSDLLIHEATFEEGMEDMARSKRHSTIPQALQVAKDMNAKFTILTHYSQRYAIIPQLYECFENFGAAFDNMQVSFGDFPYLPHLYPVLKKIFDGEIEKYKIKKLHRDLEL